MSPKILDLHLAKENLSTEQQLNNVIGYLSNQRGTFISNEKNKKEEVILEKN